jgi:putative serine protease PepD
MSSPGQPRHGSRAGLVIVVALAALLGGVAGGLIVQALKSKPGASRQEAAQTATPSPASCSVTRVAVRDLPAVVTIEAEGEGAQGVGSGDVIRSDGYVLTNNHVVAAAANGGRVQVVFNDGKTAPATISGRDPATDLAVLKVSGAQDLRTIALGSDREVKIGAPVIAIGAPLGLSNTVTSGIVSALDRTVAVPGESAQSALLVDAIQTDAAINPGNSGGALLNCAGRLIGVPSAGATVPNESGESSGGSIGLGFAIPVDLAKTVSEEIISTGKATHSYIGLQAEPAQGPDGTPRGLRVVIVDPSGPAQMAGLRAGDLITAIEGETAGSTDQLIALTLTRRSGQTLRLEIERDGRRRSITLTLGRAE